MWLDVMIYNAGYISLVDQRGEAIWSFIHKQLHTAHCAVTWKLFRPNVTPSSSSILLDVDHQLQKFFYRLFGGKRTLVLLNPPSGIHVSPASSSYLVQEMMNDDHRIVSVASPEIQFQVFWKGNQVVQRAFRKRLPLYLSSCSVCQWGSCHSHVDCLIYHWNVLVCAILMV